MAARAKQGRTEEETRKDAEKILAEAKAQAQTVADETLKKEKQRREEEKMELKEPQKLLGTFDGSGVCYADFVVSAHCNRVPTRNGHLGAANYALLLLSKADLEAGAH